MVEDEQYETTEIDEASSIISNLPATGKWFVLHTKSRQEKALAEDLTRAKVGHFLPVGVFARRYGHRKAKAKVALPLFSGYLFLRGTAEDTYLANRTKRVARIIEVKDQSRLEWELTNLHLALQHKVPIDPFPYLAKGMRVEVRTGPLRGLQGFIEDRLSIDRLILKVDMLGQAISLEVSGAQLDPI
ncbi:MAG TPA: transcription termination/antitermination NusG family protein [Tepidisphaeraceae bacterium]|nr:transcription termination/antitermination NusG family protein [Tepidisphaeraceae bacterium]